MFSHPDYDGHEALLFTQDAASGLRALIAIHDTTLGPAFGGCRMYPYASEQHAMTDVLRLSRGMTYKAAICELPYGGGKSVMIADPRRDKTPALLHAMGRIIEGLGGRYITADDVGTTLADLIIMREGTCRSPGATAAGPTPSLRRRGTTLRWQYAASCSCRTIWRMPAASSTSTKKPSTTSLTRCSLRSRASAPSPATCCAAPPRPAPPR